jgi:hypothetical protein
MGIKTLPTRIRLHRVLDKFVERTEWTLDKVRGLGIESRLVRWTAIGAVIAGLVKAVTNPHLCTTKISPTTARLAFAVWPPQRPGWIQLGSLWAVVHSSPESAVDVDPGTVWLAATEAELWTELRDAFAERYPAAQLAEHRDGVRVTGDRATNVRRLTPSERELATRVAKYVDARVSTSVLLYGPQGSAKTTAACSIASTVCGSYFRLSADHVGSEEIYALVDLRPRAVVIDDIDRVHDVALLEMLDTLTSAGVIVFATSNTSPDARHGDDTDDLMDAALVRSGRFDIHHPVYQLDPESHAQICRDNGLSGVELGPRSAELLASDLVALGRMHRADDLPHPIEAAEDMLLRRTNTTRRLKVQPKFTLTAVTKPG